MDNSLQRLLPLFDRELASASPMVLATVIRTAGPTYTKPGAQMLIAQGGECAGLLSGGCLEGDLGERAARVFASGRAEIVRYDMRGPEDLLFGLGSGCEGAMDILLQRLDTSGNWQPLRRQTEAWRARRPERILVVSSVSPEFPEALGAGMLGSDGATFGAFPTHWAPPLRELSNRFQHRHGNHLLINAISDAEILLLQQSPPLRLLLLGAGPDALPVVHLAAFLGWSVTVIDHRSHYAQADRLNGADAVFDGGIHSLVKLLGAASTGHFAAAVVMSHHLLTDLGYLRVLAGCNIQYIGLLGPPSRRDRLLTELGPALAVSLGQRLHAPVGLDLGANSPESIALAIVAEIHAKLSHVPTATPQSISNAGPRNAADERSLA